MHGSGTTTLIISNEEMNDIMKIVRVLEDSNFLLKGVTKTIEDETKDQKGGFLSMLLGTLGASVLGKFNLMLIYYQEKELKELALVTLHKIEWIFNTASSFNKL